MQLINNSEKLVSDSKLAVPCQPYHTVAGTSHFSLQDIHQLLLDDTAATQYAPVERHGYGIPCISNQQTDRM